MSHFFLHLHEGETVTVDEEGYDFATEDQARAAAIRSAREIMCADLHAGCLCLNCYIEVHNADAGSSFNIQFRDTVVITGQ